MSALSACMYRNFIFVSFVISYFSLCFLFCMSVFVDRTLSFLISCRFQLKILITIVLLIDSFLLSLPFRCQYRELFCQHKPSEHIKTQLVVSAGCTGAGTLSQAKIQRLHCSAKVALYRERSHCSFTSQYLASQHYKIISAWTDWWCRQHYWVDCQGLSETLRNWKRVYCTCVVLALLEIHLNSVYSHPVFALLRSKVSTRIPVQQYRLRIGFHNHFMNANYTSSRLKDQFCNMMCGLPITDNDVVLWKVCYNCRHQDVSSYAKIETICCTIKNVEWNNALVGTNNVLLWVHSITYTRRMNDAEQNLNPTIFDVPHSTVILCELQYAWNGHPLQLNTI